MSVVFFFKQKTAYEMRISDWSSDVCSSYLWIGRVRVLAAGEFDGIANHLDELALWGLHLNDHAATCGARILKGLPNALYQCGRDIAALEVVTTPSCILSSEARRAGNECLSTVKSRWAHSQ